MNIIIITILIVVIILLVFFVLIMGPLKNMLFPLPMQPPVQPTRPTDDTTTIIQPIPTYPTYSGWQSGWNWRGKHPRRHRRRSHPMPINRKDISVKPIGLNIT